MLLVTACSQTNSSEPETVTSSVPTIAQPQTTASTEAVLPSTAKAPTKTAPTALPRTQSANQAPSSVQKSSPQSAPATRLAAVNSSASLNPTYRAEPRMAGFSSDGNYYIYLESSRDTGAGIPRSSLQVVDIASNNCVAKGCIETRYQESDAPLEIKAAEDTLLQQTWKIRQDLKLTPPATGTELPILSRSRTADGTETVNVRLNNRDQLRLQLRQRRKVAEGASQLEQAAMQLEVSYNGQRRSLDSLSNFRNFVLDYSIRTVKVSPDGEQVAVLITATKPTFEGTLGTTLVLGFDL